MELDLCQKCVYKIYVYILFTMLSAQTSALSVGFAVTL